MSGLPYGTLHKLARQGRQERTVARSVSVAVERGGLEPLPGAYREAIPGLAPLAWDS